MIDYFWNWLFLKVEILNYHTLIKAYKNLSYKRKKSFFSVFEKSYKEKRKKSNISISRTLYTQKIKICMHIFFFKKSLFEYENQLAVKKKRKKNFWG